MCSALCAGAWTGGLEEKNLKEMLRFANAAASLITTRKGALRVMPERKKLKNVIRNGRAVPPISYKENGSILHV